MKHLPLLAALLAVPLALTACSTIDKPPHAVKPDNVSGVRYPQIATEGNLGNHLSYAKPIVRSDGQTPMSVTVPIRLRDNQSANAQYRFTFLAAAIVMRAFGVDDVFDRQIEIGVIGGQPGQAGGRQRHAVITAQPADDLLLFRPSERVVEIPHQLDRGIVRLRPRIGEKHLRHRHRRHRR